MCQRPFHRDAALPPSWQASTPSTASCDWQLDWLSFANSSKHSQTSRRYKPAAKPAAIRGTAQPTSRPIARNDINDPIPTCTVQRGYMRVTESNTGKATGRRCTTHTLYLLASVGLSWRRMVAGAGGGQPSSGKRKRAPLSEF
jgi:hypothetical protein